MSYLADLNTEVAKILAPSLGMIFQGTAAQISILPVKNKLRVLLELQGTHLDELRRVEMKGIAILILLEQLPLMTPRATSRTAAQNTARPAARAAWQVRIGKERWTPQGAWSPAGSPLGDALWVQLDPLLAPH